MQQRDLFNSLLLACLIFGAGSGSVFSQDVLYEWLEDGVRKIGNPLPPEFIDKGYKILDAKTGRIRQIIEPKRTPEQQEFDKRLEELRLAEAKLIKRQQTHDKVLLATYRTKNDLISAIETKMHSLETLKTALEGDLTRFTRQLEEQQKNAAAFERNGEKVPLELLEHIKSSQQQIMQARELITDHAIKMEQSKKEYDSNVERFLFLTQTNTPGPKIKLASIKEASELGLFYCENDRQCNKAWEIGRTFVQYNSTTPADIFNDKLIMNRPPATDEDLSLSLSKIALPNDEYQLFLDILCRDSVPGKALCASQRVRDIRSAFRPYVNEALLRAAQQ